MNVYDFDETIFYPNSLFAFNFYCWKKYPSLWFKHFLKVLFPMLKYGIFKKDLGPLTIKMSKIACYLKEPGKTVENFWKENEWRISKWYLDQKKSDDLIISGSPTYLIEPLAKQLGVNCIASEFDIKTGTVIGNVCLAKEKASYIINMEMPKIDNFYSDSLGDTPIALLAEKAFMVIDKAKTVIPWPHITKELTKKIKFKINDGHRILEK